MDWFPPFDEDVRKSPLGFKESLLIGVDGICFVWFFLQFMITLDFYYVKVLQGESQLKSSNEPSSIRSSCL